MCKFYAVLLFFSSFFLANFAQALPPVVTSERWLVTRDGEAESEKPAPNLSLTLQNSQYVNADRSYYQTDAAHENHSLRLDWQQSKRFLRHAVAHGQLSDEFSASEQWNYLNVHEAYAGWEATNVAVYAGRKLETWADWETRWNQGLFQPRYMQNRLHPEVAGLSGVFATSRVGKWGATLALLPLHVPEMGAHYELQNHQFVSRNPWFRSPPEQFNFNNVNTDIRYSVNTPSTGSVLDHRGGVAKIEYRGEVYSSRLSYAYKPLTQLRLAFPTDQQWVLGERDSYMNVRIEPSLVYSRTLNWDHEVVRGPWRFSLSAAHDNPQTNAYPRGWTAQTFREVYIFSGAVSRRLEDAGPHAAAIEFSVLKVSGGEERDEGTLAGESSLFEPRFQYFEAYSLGLQKEFRLGWRYPLETRLRGIFDRMQNGATLSLGSAMNLSRHWRVDFAAEFLGLINSNRAERSGFLASYRANDRVGVGVTYVY